MNNQKIRLICGALCFTLAACSKTSVTPETTTTSTARTITATVAENGTYSYTLPTATSYSILQPSSTGAKSTVLPSGATVVYSYDAATNFTGADSVTILATTTDTVSTGGGCNGGSGKNSMRTAHDTLHFYIQVENKAG